MSDVRVSYADAAEAKATAILLVDAVDTLDLDQSVVKTFTDAFVVPVEVADEAGVDYFPCPACPEV